MSDYTPSLDEVLSEALMEVYDNGTNPNALREARAVIARVGESAWAEDVRAEEREKAARLAEREIPEMGPHILETDYRRGKAVTASDIAARIRNQEAGE